MSTTVVVVNWNNSGLTLRCVARLDEQVRALASSDPDVAVVVVDNGSTDGSLDVLSAALSAGRIVALPTNLGFAGGVNAAIRAHPADSYVLVNNDAEPTDGFLAALVAAEAEAPGDVGAITSRILLRGAFRPAIAADDPAAVLVKHDGSRWTRDDGGARLLNSTGGVVDDAGNGSDRNWLDPEDTVASPDVFGFSGGGALLRRRALDDVGLFNESFFMYYEDTELSWRLARRGWKVVYAPRATLDHEHAASSGTTSDLFVFRNARNRLVTALWHAPWPVVLRGTARTAARAARLALASGTRHEARVVGGALGDVVQHLPAHLRRRRRLDRLATVARDRITTGPR